MYKILSFGAGVQTTALLFMDDTYDYVVFADTGNEHPETYDYITNYVIPYCNERKIKFVRVYNKYGKTLYEYCFDKKIVPSIRFRDCTSKFKIAPIRKFLRKELGVTRKWPCILHIGISYDEIERLHESNVQYVVNKYPLIELKMTREDCKKEITKRGYPVPPKSGCTMCPFSTAIDITDPRFVDMNIALEENGSRFPEIKLRGMENVKTIRELKILSDNDNLTEKDMCKSGYCMV